MSLQRNYYEVLGLPPGATTDEIKKKYRELARKFHPDVVQDKVLGQRVFTQINQAYSVLGNPERRAEYNSTLQAGGAAPNGTGPSNAAPKSNGSSAAPSQAASPSAPRTAGQPGQVPGQRRDAGPGGERHHGRQAGGSPHPLRPHFGVRSAPCPGIGDFRGRAGPNGPPRGSRRPVPPGAGNCAFHHDPGQAEPAFCRPAVQPPRSAIFAFRAPAAEKRQWERCRAKDHAAVFCRRERGGNRKARRSFGTPARTKVAQTLKKHRHLKSTDT